MWKHLYTGLFFFGLEVAGVYLETIPESLFCLLPFAFFQFFFYFFYF